ncbi:N-acetylmuramoyl-L-alanine amidase [Ruminococcus sp.]|uniref:N-acetylmuramoyl-L-alanine amidase n=1 Tax=Ruminococcus sp. TaxID=41978 RepID=UPI003F05AD86
MIVLVDRGHGIETLGKRSPDGVLREWKYCNEIATEVVKRLKTLGYNAQMLVTEENDISLATRCRRANEVCKHFGASNVLLVSIHLNAKGNGSAWMDARGWQACVSMNASAKSKQLASYLYDAAQAQALKMRSPKPGQKWWAQNLAICRDTNCPAVLTENLFQDNKQDYEYLLSDEGREAIINLHVSGIINYIKSL